MGDACTPDFVGISENGTHFEVNGAPFFFGGCNTYHMMASAPLHIAMLWVTNVGSIRSGIAAQKHNPPLFHLFLADK